MFRLLIAAIATLIVAGLTHAEIKFEPYTEAREASLRDKKPLLVLLSGNDCAACKVLEQVTLQSMADDNAFQGYRLTKIVSDDSQEVAFVVESLVKITGSKARPQIFLFTFEENANRVWFRQSIRSRNDVESLLRAALEKK